MTSLAKSICVWLIVLWFCAIALAQTGDGSIAGNVRDSSGGAIPNAAITVTSVEQGFVRTTASNSTGDYLVPGLPPGAYNVTVTAQGFERYNIENLVLRVAEKVARTRPLQSDKLAQKLPWLALK
jgi:hypothetical protein